nr:reverse transcriptase domain-containing protein [Tanacetum cinerariifolium]
DDIEAYNNRFHELALICPEFVPNEKKKIESYIQGFPKVIKRNITSSRPKTLHDAINMARELVKQAVQVELQELVKIIKGSRKTNKGTTITNKDKKLLRLMLQPRLRVAATLGTYHGAIGVEGTSSARGNSLQNVTCFGCGEKGHHMDNCPRGRNLKNEGARGRAYVMRTQEPQPNPNEGPCHGESSHLEFFYNGSTLVYHRMTVTVSLSIHLVCYRHQLNSGDQSSLRGIDCEISLYLECMITLAPILLTLPNRFKTGMLTPFWIKIASIRVAEAVLYDFQLS